MKGLPGCPSSSSAIARRGDESRASSPALIKVLLCTEVGSCLSVDLPWVIKSCLVIIECVLSVAFEGAWSFIPYIKDQAMKIFRKELPTCAPSTSETSPQINVTSPPSASTQPDI